MDTWINYCQTLTDEFYSKFNRSRNFVGHNLTSGIINEDIVRDLIHSLCSQNYGVSQGFIYDLFETDTSSAQCDILVYDVENYPIIYSGNSIKIVFPQSVRLAIEIKTTLSRRCLLKAMSDANSIKRLDARTQCYIFSYRSSISVATIRDILYDSMNSSSKEDIPYHIDAIMVLDKNFIATRSIYGDLCVQLRNTTRDFTFYTGKDTNTNIVIPFLALRILELNLRYESSAILNYEMKFYENYTKCPFN